MNERLCTETYRRGFRHVSPVWPWIFALKCGGLKFWFGLAGWLWWWWQLNLFWISDAYQRGLGQVGQAWPWIFFCRNGRMDIWSTICYCKYRFATIFHMRCPYFNSHVPTSFRFGLFMPTPSHSRHTRVSQVSHLSLIHIWRCRRLLTCRSRWSPYH